MDRIFAEQSPFLQATYICSLALLHLFAGLFFAVGSQPQKLWILSPREKYYTVYSNMQQWNDGQFGNEPTPSSQGHAGAMHLGGSVICWIGIGLPEQAMKHSPLGKMLKVNLYYTKIFML